MAEANQDGMTLRLVDEDLDHAALMCLGLLDLGVKVAMEVNEQWGKYTVDRAADTEVQQLDIARTVFLDAHQHLLKGDYGITPDGHFARRSVS